MIELLILTALFGALYVIQLRAQAKERQEWREERSELLTRIQHPERVILPSKTRDGEEEDPLDQGEMHLVGRILTD